MEKSIRELHKTGGPWWGGFSLAENASGKWTIAGSVFRVIRLPEEWRIVTGRDISASENTAAIDLPAPLTDNTLSGSVSRFGMSKTSETIRIMPALPDRPVVIQSASPFYLMPGQSIAIYVSSPLWITFATGSPLSKMTEMPIFRPSDTWFGPPTSQGELCYAATTSGRLSQEEIVYNPHKAITVALIRNQTATTFHLNTLKLPVTHLSLYESEDGVLWTQPVRLDVTDNTEGAELSLKQRPPAEAKNARLIVEPRIKAADNKLTQALSRLIK